MKGPVGWRISFNILLYGCTSEFVQIDRGEQTKVKISDTFSTIRLTCLQNSRPILYRGMKVCHSINYHNSQACICSPFTPNRMFRCNASVTMSAPIDGADLQIWILVLISLWWVVQTLGYDTFMQVVQVVDHCQSQYFTFCRSQFHREPAQQLIHHASHMSYQNSHYGNQTFRIHSQHSNSWYSV